MWLRLRQSISAAIPDFRDQRSRQRAQKPGAVRPSRESRPQARPQKRFYASLEQCLMDLCADSQFLISSYKFIRRCVEGFLIVVGTEIVSLAIEDRFR